MKTYQLILTAVVALPAGLRGAGGVPAKEAIRTVGRERGASYLGRVQQVTGERGVDQPGVWRVVASDTGGTVREFYVNNGTIISEGPVPATAADQLRGPQIPLKTVVVDSTTAFMRAEQSAKKARIGFDSVNYQLRSSASSPKPVWALQLMDARGLKLGEVTVSASSGKVLQSAWYPAPQLVQQQPPPAPPPAQQSGAVQQVWHRTRDVVARGTTSVRSGLTRAGQWIRGKFRPAAPAAPAPPAQQAQQAPYYVPSRGS